MNDQIDREYLAEISDGDTEFEQELVQTFLETAPELITDLDNALLAGDAKQATHAAHTLKGSSRAIGAAPFSMFCEAAERAARENDLGACRSHFAEIKTSFELLLKAGQTFLATAA